jgi:hypothetical protein
VALPEVIILFRKDEHIVLHETKMLLHRNGNSHEAEEWENRRKSLSAIHQTID